MWCRVRARCLQTHGLLITVCSLLRGLRGRFCGLLGGARRTSVGRESR